MKKWAWLILLAVTTGALFFVGTPKAADIDTLLEMNTGYRVDDLDWNIAGNMDGTNPNIFSELTWSDLEIFQIKAGMRAAINNAIYVRASLAYGWILGGENQDSDYSGDNRTQEYSRSHNKADDGDVWDATLGLGYQFNLLSKRLRLIPLAGYSYSEQNLVITDGLQTISEPALVPPGERPPSPLGPITGLDSIYETQWTGPWLGLDVWFQASQKIMLFGSFEYHWADYEAVANWNLVDEFAHPTSFEHEADGSGIVITVAGEYVLKGPWSLSLTASYQDWSTDPGTDRLYYADGATVDTRLNEVNWESYAILVGITYRFHSKLW
jgi:hypothetical protein